MVINHSSTHSLQKPTSEEKYDISIFNTNMDLIDSALHQVEEKNRLQDELLASKEALGSETERAIAKEAEIIQKLNIETSRAENAEASLSADVTAENNRAVQAENNIRESLSGHLSSASNPHQVSKAQVGLANVDNTSDVNKPVSAAQQEALDTYYLQSSGYTDQKIADLIGGAPSTLDTLGEIAQAMQDNEDVVQALDAAIGKKANEAEFDSFKRATDALIGNTDITGVGDGTVTGAVEGLKGAILELKNSVADGKASVASAITEKGVPTAQDATFSELTENISLIGGVENNVSLAGKPLIIQQGYGGATAAANFTITDGKKYLIVASGAEVNMSNAYDAISVVLTAGGSAAGIVLNERTITAPGINGGAIRRKSMYHITDGTNQTLTLTTKATTFNGYGDGSGKYGQAAYAEIIAFRLE